MGRSCKHCGGAHPGIPCTLMKTERGTKCRPGLKPLLEAQRKEDEERGVPVVQYNVGSELDGP